MAAHKKWTYMLYVAPLFHWVATLDKFFTRTVSSVSHLQETGVQKGFRRLNG